jgi:AraC family transcriptional regulator
VNDALYYIYRYIDTDISIGTLADEVGMSRFHFQRIFKEQMGINLYEKIRMIRLQKAASLLLTNPGSTITEVAQMCGYGSQSAFIKVFKERFDITPTQWRKGGYLNYASWIVGEEQRDNNVTVPKARILRRGDMKAYYLRHRGYTPEVYYTWQKIQAWIHTNNIERYETIGIYHDNPVITPLNRCDYVAAVHVPEEMEPVKTLLPCFVIPGGLYAVFDIKGSYGDILRLMRRIYHDWLPKSGYETTTLPAYTVFEVNHFLEGQGNYRGEFYLPIRLR